MSSPKTNAYEAGSLLGLGRAVLDIEARSIQELSEQLDASFADAASALLECDGRIVVIGCLLYTSPSPRDQRGSRMPSSA